MPRYEFVCSECDNVSEVKRTIEDRNRVTQCLEVRGLGEEPCGGELIRQWTPPSIVIKYG